MRYQIGDKTEDRLTWEYLQDFRWLTPHHARVLAREEIAESQTSAARRKREREAVWNPS